MLLADYLADKKIPHRDFAAAIGVTVQSVYRYAAGERIPEPTVMARIKHATNDAVTADDFYPAEAAE